MKLEHGYVHDTRNHCMLRCDVASSAASLGSSGCHDLDACAGESAAARTERRFWAKVDKSGDCWLWTASKVRGGYGEFWISTGANRLRARAHRWSWESVHGPVPAGLHLDHLCRTPQCVNPAHLEPVTPAENTRRGLAGFNHARKDRCPAGHAFTEANTYVCRRPDGSFRQRRCRTCQSVANAKSRLSRPRGATW